MNSEWAEWGLARLAHKCVLHIWELQRVVGDSWTQELLWDVLKLCGSERTFNLATETSRDGTNSGLPTGFYDYKKALRFCVQIFNKSLPSGRYRRTGQWVLWFVEGYRYRQSIRAKAGIFLSPVSSATPGNNTEKYIHTVYCDIRGQSRQNVTVSH